MNRQAVGTSVVLGLLGFYMLFVHHQEAYQAGLTWNIFNGQMQYESQGGYHVSPPWVFVSRIDTRPMRVCVTSASRGYSCKLAQFDPTHWKEFLATEGWRYYWWDNRFSFNFGYDEEYRGQRDLIRGYTYSAERYPFVKVLQEYAP